MFRRGGYAVLSDSCFFLAAAGTADYKNVLVAGIFRLLRAAVHGESFRLREGDIVLKYRVCVRLYVLGVSP